MTDDEIKRLTKCAFEWRGTTFAADLSALLAEVERLRAELAEAQIDAERYKWLAENAIINTYEFDFDGEDLASTTYELDRLIDAAMKLA